MRLFKPIDYIYASIHINSRNVLFGTLEINAICIMYFIVFNWTVLIAYLLRHQITRLFGNIKDVIPALLAFHFTFFLSLLYWRYINKEKRGQQLYEQYKNTSAADKMKGRIFVLAICLMPLITVVVLILNR